MNSFVHDWAPIIAAAFSLLATFAAYFVRSEAKNVIARAERDLSRRVDGLHDRILHLEGNMEALPTRKDFHELAIANTEMIGEMKAMKEAMKGMHETVNATRASVQRINDYLLTSKAQ